MRGCRFAPRFRAFFFGALLSAQFFLGAHAAPASPLKICLLSASSEYQSDKSLAEFQRFLESKYPIVCQRAFGKDKGEGLPGIDGIDKSDLVIIFTRRVTLPPEQLEHLKHYLAAGRPVIGLRTASHAFANYLEFDREILGGGYTGHYTDSSVQVSLVASNANHPLLRGVVPFSSRKLYKNPTHAPDITVLLEGAIPSHTEPVAWARLRAGGRLFYTSLGTPEDFQQESFRTLLVNAIFWTTNHEK